MESELMTSAEVASALRAPEASIRYWRYQHKGPRWFKIGRRVLYMRSDVDLYIEHARSTAAARALGLPPISASTATATALHSSGTPAPARGSDDTRADGRST